jgi:energy-coupling factor transporter ATP-binding protein EcfA2
LVKVLLDKLAESNFLAVLGPSGSGKSRLVLAGLLPALKAGALPGSEGWCYLTLRPGTRPLDALAVAVTTAASNISSARFGSLLELRRALASDERALLLAADLLLTGRALDEARIILVVDQFEELWTQALSNSATGPSHAEMEQQHFVRLLLAAVGVPDGASSRSPLIIILTLRADFLHHAAENPKLASLIGEHDVIVSPMSSDELCQSIERPAATGGGSFESGLVDELMGAVLNRAGALPLLEYALLELWKARRPDGIMTWTAFHALGGVAGALEHRAEALFKQLSPLEQLLCQRIFLRLIKPGAGVEDTRRRVLLSELRPGGDQLAMAEGVIERLAGPEARLVTIQAQPQPSEDQLVEITHEALIRHWTRLRRWIEADREALRTRDRLTEAANEWATEHKDESYLYRGARLAEVEEWAEQHQEELNSLEREFLDTSLALRDQEAREAERQRQQQLEAAQRLAEAETQRAQAAEAQARLQARSAAQLRWAFMALLILAIAPSIMFEFIIGSLVAAGGSSSLLSLELAGDVPTVHAIISSWDQSARTGIGFGIGLGFLFSFAFAAILGFACGHVSSIFQTAGQLWLAGLGLPLAWAQGVAALLNATADVAALVMLLNTTTAPWPQLARWATLGTVLFHLVAGLYIAVGAIVWLRLRRNREHSQLLQGRRVR